MKIVLVIVALVAVVLARPSKDENLTARVMEKVMVKDSELLKDFFEGEIKDAYAEIQAEDKETVEKNQDALVDFDVEYAQNEKAFKGDRPPPGAADYADLDSDLDELFKKPSSDEQNLNDVVDQINLATNQNDDNEITDPYLIPDNQYQKTAPSDVGSDEHFEITDPYLIADKQYAKTPSDGRSDEQRLEEVRERAEDAEEEKKKAINDLIKSDMVEKFKELSQVSVMNDYTHDDKRAMLEAEIKKEVHDAIQEELKSM